MNGSERRLNIIRMLQDSEEAISGRALAHAFGVSRQVIVQDIALLRAADHEIASTNLGYVLMDQKKISRVFKVIHTDEQTRDELNLIVDYGGVVEDVFVYHKIYGTIKGEMCIRSRKDVEDFVADIATGKSTFLKNVTCGYHYHTVSAPSVVILDLIQEKLAGMGMLAKLQDYEPINFWGEHEE